MNCTECFGRGYIVDFQHRKVCPDCAGSGQAPHIDPGTEQPVYSWVGAPCNYGVACSFDTAAFDKALDDAKRVTDGMVRDLQK